MKLLIASLAGQVEVVAGSQLGLAFVAPQAVEPIAAL
jgi:hypothetical protein